VPSAGSDLLDVASSVKTTPVALPSLEQLLSYDSFIGGAAPSQQLPMQEALLLHHFFHPEALSHAFALQTTPYQEESSYREFREQQSISM